MEGREREGGETSEVKTGGNSRRKKREMMRKVSKR